MDQDLLKKDSNDNRDSNKNDDNVTRALDNFHIMFERVKLFVFLMGFGKLFNKKRTMYNKVSCPVLVLRKGR